MSEPKTEAAGTTAAHTTNDGSKRLQRKINAIVWNADLSPEQRVLRLRALFTKLTKREQLMFAVLMSCFAVDVVDEYMRANDVGLRERPALEKMAESVGQSLGKEPAK